MTQKQKTGVAHYHAPWGFLYKDRAIKGLEGLVVCFELYQEYEVKDQVSNLWVDNYIRITRPKLEILHIWTKIWDKS